jgi:hypothetical protein
MNTMTTATVKFTAQEQPPETRKLSGSWKYWLVLGAVALIAGLAFNWSWLVAAGAAPVVLSILPCLAMCALHLCANKGVDGSCTGRRAETSGGQPHAAGASEQPGTRDNR